MRVQLLVIFGPPAVGKMSVAREVAARSSYRVFHNHHTIEPLIEVFDYGTPPFQVLNEEFRRRIIEEAFSAGLDLVFTVVWNVEDSGDREAVERIIAPYAASPIAFVELDADLETRLARNRTDQRLADKRSKRDLDWSDQNVRELERFRMVTDPARPSPADDLLSAYRFLRLDNSELSAVEAAERILRWLGRKVTNE